MNYKLVAVDMDGTLLNSKGEISEATVAAIGKLVDTGVIFTISTGRPVQGVEKYNSLLQLKGPVISYNGAMIFDLASGETLFHHGLLRADAAKIYELGLKYDATMCIWAGNQLYGNKMNEKLHDYKKLSGVEPLEVENFETLLDIGVTKILWYEDVEVVAKIMAELDEVSAGIFAEVTYCTSKPTFLEFFNSNVSKAEAIKKIGEIYGIKREEIIAIGDGSNDLEMIEYAGLGVAMANANDQLKNMANHVTTSNDEDGVAKVIEEFFCIKA